MLDIGWSELLVIGIVALIVVGPRDLPSMFRTVGQYVAKARGMAREFQRSMEDAARQSELQDLHRAAQSVRDLGRVATGGVSGLAQFGLDHTRRAAEQAMTPPQVDAPAQPAPAASPAPRAATPAAPAAATATPTAAIPPVATPAAPERRETT